MRRGRLAGSGRGRPRAPGKQCRRRPGAGAVDRARRPPCRRSGRLLRALLPQRGAQPRRRRPDLPRLPPADLGPHNPVWADWGSYDTPVPFRFQVHNLEHGEVIIHLGREVPASARTPIKALWAESPPFVLVRPETFARYLPTAIAVTSWQRWMVCKSDRPRDLQAIRVYRDTYRGRGPEPVGAVDPPSGERPEGLPAPAVADEGARSG